jgi:Mce-associated membrane protein
VAPDADRPVRARRRVDVVLLLAVALVVVLALTAGALVLRARSDDRVEQARTAARAAAERHAVTLLSYDHRHLDKDFAAARKVLTGGFAKDYASTTEKVVRPTAEQVKAVVTAEVASSSVVRAKDNRAVVLLFVDQTTTSTRLEGPRVDLNRVRMTLDRTGGEWLVSAVDAL